VTAVIYPPHLQPTKTISRMHAFLIRLLGPADSWDNPLMGTKYDPRLAEHRHRVAVARRRARASGRTLRAQPLSCEDYDAFAPALAS
jgi:hypothetical protein